MAHKKNRVFPQANSIPLILSTLKFIGDDSETSKESIAQNLSVVPRQVDYYINVLYYFELISNQNELTLKGRFINDPVINMSDKLKILKNIMVEQPIFQEIEDYILKYHKTPPIEEISGYISTYFLYSESTLTRRASTVKSWFDYYIENHVYGG
jgi:translation initiation factor 2 beta subunit (eIF-2beta)/eIF-5